jgi:hypothetical protein
MVSHMNVLTRQYQLYVCYIILFFNRLMNGDPLYIHMASRLQDVGEPRSHDRGISSNPSLAVANCPLN